jgi:hypothetical protein
MSSQVQNAPGPEWVNRGTPCWLSSNPRAFYGVGLASGITNPTMRIATSDTRARTEIGRCLDGYVSALEKGSAPGAAGGDDPLRKYVQNELTGQAQIADHWVANDGTEYSLARLEVEAFKSNVEKAKEVDEGKRQAVRANADRAFDEMSADETRRQR